MALTITIPSRLTPDELLPFSAQLRAAVVEESYLLDFRGVGHVEPFGMLFLAALIRQFVRSRRQTQGKDCEIRVANYADKTYASWMGLFKSFGLDHGNGPGEASGSGTYIPLTRLTVSRIVGEARDEYVHHGEVIEEEARRITHILTRNDSGDITETLTYAIREIMRNVVEHGNTSHIWYAAQYWPTKSRVEVSILDEGIGLLPSLRRNPRLNVDSNQKAIFMALQPGVSGVAKEKRRRSDGDWVNSGYGLFMTSSLCQVGGDFTICNDVNALRLDADGSRFIDCAFQGVAIRMVLDTSKMRDLNSSLSELRDKGQAIAKELGNEDTELTASKMSRMLSKKI
jgi:hypothetical protein